MIFPSPRKPREVEMRFRKTLTLCILTTGLFFALSSWAQEQPYTQEQVSNMVRAGLGDDFGAKLIGERGITFVPAEGFLQSLKAAGAKDAFLNALRATKTPKPGSVKKPISRVQVFALLAAQVPSGRVAGMVTRRGIDFDAQEDYLRQVRMGGGDDDLISALKSAKVIKTATVDQAAQARQAEVQQHAARGAELTKKGQYTEAEKEFRAALRLDSQDADLHASLGVVLGQQQKWDDAASAVREAIRLNPNNDLAHALLGVALGGKGDLDGMVSEEREAFRLNPYNDAAHFSAGVALGNKGDWDGAIAQYREALHINSNNPMGHYNLGTALGNKGDWDGAITEFRAAVRINPDNEMAHYNLGTALGSKGNWDGEITEERETLRLNPKNDAAHCNLGVALLRKGELPAALEEFRTAYMNDPNKTTCKQNYERLQQQLKK
jgi:tetratricopeptide (TPR) repeat protein